MSARATPGVCRYCGCDDEHACRTPPCGEPCNWLDFEHTVCSGCIARWQADNDRAAADGFRAHLAARRRAYDKRRQRQRKGKAA